MTDVLIVGGGIGGSVLALALGLRGWRVRILEREPGPPRWLRPEILQGATLDALDRLGVGPRIRAEAALPIHGAILRRRGEPLFRIEESDFRAADFTPFSTDPSATRALILEAAVATGQVDLVRGAEVTNVVHYDKDSVGVSGLRAGEAFEQRGRLLIGDDGANSILRGKLGIPARLRLFPIEFITFCLPRPPELEPEIARGWLNPDAFRTGLFGGLALPVPGDRIVGVLFAAVGVWEERYEGRPEPFWGDVAGLVPFVDALRERLQFPDDFTRVRRTYGHVPTYVANGAALLGDAAHPMSPVGGQGANAAVWDALALADVADDALRADDLSARRLSAYDIRRRAANTRSLWFTRRAVTLVRLAHWLPNGGSLILSLIRLAGPERLLRLAATAFRDPGAATDER